MSVPNFPEHFLFGTATSAYQIEGSHNAEGKGLSIWDDFASRPGKIFANHSGERAAETYLDFQTDIDIMCRLGLDAYRFSVSWPRVLPEGHGRVNVQGLDYYDRLVDALLAANLTPFVTLFHWDLPLALFQEKRGFESRDCARYFADYAAIVAERLGDRVKYWITLNEPWVHATLGHLRGLHAPGRLNPWAYMKVIHHQLLGHGLATERLRALDPAAHIGLSLNLSPTYPLRDTEEDRAAASLGDQFTNRMYLDSIFRGRYPEPLWNRLRPFHPPIESGDMDIISRPIDFLGINYYTRVRFKHAWYIPYFHAWPEGLPVIQGARPAKPANGVSYSAMGWEVYPAGLFELLFRLKQEYGNPPIYITENGAAFPDRLVDGCVRDPERAHYLEQHLTVTAAAIRAGVDVRGYFVWSLIDNFEWQHGYEKRFGIVYVDFDTQRRTIKDSGYWYRDFIRNSRAQD
jgi:beta-glucosidase